MVFRNILASISLILLGWIGCQAQDIHYSQFYNAPILLNPAQTGVFNGDLRIQGNYRNQWYNVPVDYRTFTVVVDKKFISRFDGSSFFAAGLGLNYDRAGDGNLSWTDVNLNGSYTRYLNDGFFLSFGGQVAYAQRRFDANQLRFDDQFNPGTGAFDPGIATGEQFASDNNSFIDFSIGVNFHLQALKRYERFDYLTKRSKIDFGIALMHLGAPDQTFIGNASVPIYRRLSAYADGVLQLSEDSPLDVVGGISGQFQGPYREIVTMFGLRFHVNRKPGKQFAIQGGLGYRFGDISDAYYPTLQLHYNAFRVGLSYDANISDFNIATQRNGGPEISLQYLFKKVRPVRARRGCPII